MDGAYLAGGSLPPNRQPSLPRLAPVAARHCRRRRPTRTHGPSGLSTVRSTFRSSVQTLPLTITEPTLHLRPTCRADTRALGTQVCAKHTTSPLSRPSVHSSPSFLFSSDVLCLLSCLQCVLCHLKHPEPIKLVNICIPSTSAAA